MAKKILFVGGPSDGKRMELPNDSPTCVVPIFDGPVYDLHTGGCLGIQTFEYTKQRFRGPDGTEHSVMMDSSIKDPMEALIKGYRYHRNPRRKSMRSKIKGMYSNMKPYDPANLTDCLS